MTDCVVRYPRSTAAAAAAAAALAPDTTYRSGTTSRGNTTPSLSRRPSLDSVQTVARCVQTLTQKNYSILALAATPQYIFSGNQGGRINVRGGPGLVAKHYAYEHCNRA